MQHKNFFLSVVFAAAAVVAGLAGPRTVHAANVYAEYADGATAGAGFYGLNPSYALGEGRVDHIQVELDITNDEQRGTSYYCPTAPNTGVLVFIFRNGNFVYQHCITSAEAAGKLGRKAVYTFDDVTEFGYGTDLSVEFASQGTFDAEVYGTNVSGTFYPYLVFGDRAGLGTASMIGGLGQYSADVASDTAALIPENGFADGSAVRFEGAVSSFFASDTLALQVEVQPSSAAFTGLPTATSAPVPSGGTASTTVGGLAGGAYHWAARAVDTVNGIASPWMEYRTSGNVDFNVPSIREPVVIIPGTMGSALDRVADGTEVWPNAAKMALSGSDNYLDDLKLTASGAATTPVAVSGVVRSELGIPFYAPLIQALKGDGYEESSTLFVAPYDWRLGIASSVDEIAPVLARAAASSPDGKINVIAHSMGGLLIKEYLAHAPSSSVAAVHTLILAGTPQLGSPLAYKLLNYGDDLGMDWLGLGLNQGEAKAIAQNMPGVYDLLPTRRYVAVNGGYVQDFRNGADTVLGFDATNDLMHANAADSRNAAMLAGADAFHAALDSAPVNASSVYNIVGCLTPTIAGFDLYDRGVVTLKSATGDGTVPETSAMNLANGFHNYFVLGNETGVDHVGLVTDARPLALITGILDGAVSGAASGTLPQGISSSLGDCVAPSAAAAGNETTIEFSTHSPVALNVYDASGRHTGPVADGAADDFEMAIPGSRYETIGENTFVFVPGGADYKVVDQGLASGTFEMNVIGYAGSAAVQKASYLSVPLAGASTTAVLNFSGFGGNMGMSLDENGDGAADATVQPSAMLTDSGNTASSTMDVTPPVIVLPAIPATVTQGATTTLAWSVTDSGSGVATTTATLNGVPVTNGTPVTFSKIGGNIFAVTAYDKAGNPRIAETDFTVAPAPSPTPSPTSTPTPIPDPTPAPTSTLTAPATLRISDLPGNRILIEPATSTQEFLAEHSSTILTARMVFTVKNNILEPFRIAGPQAPWHMALPRNIFSAFRGVAPAPHNAPRNVPGNVSRNATATISFDVTDDVRAMMQEESVRGWTMARDDAFEPWFAMGRQAAPKPVLVVTYGAN